MTTPSIGQQPDIASSARTVCAGEHRPPVQRTDSPLPPEPPEPDLSALSLPELRTLRREAQRDEADLSYVRRLLQGRIDILRAELTRRGGTAVREGGTAASEGGTAAREGGTAEPGSGIAAPEGGTAPQENGTTERETGTLTPQDGFVRRLTAILTDAPAAQRSSARHVTVGTPRSERYRRLAAEMLGEVGLSDPEARTDEELTAGLARLARHERKISRSRRTLQRTTDHCTEEIARRYRDGEAQVEDLLG
jgi:hypothetical protein